MKFPPHKYHELKYHLLGQTLLCGVFMGFVLLLMGVLSSNSVEWAVGATSLASSAYGVFVVPHSVVAQPKRILLAYFIATIIGLLFHAILGYFSLKISTHFEATMGSHLFWALSALAVMFTMLVMMLSGAQHPPATGIALSMVSDVSNWRIFCAIWISVLVLVAIRKIFSHRLRDLVE
jgi:CBS domain-containing membrane protein